MIETTEIEKNVENFVSAIFSGGRRVSAFDEMCPSQAEKQEKVTDQEWKTSGTLVIGFSKKKNMNKLCWNKLQITHVRPVIKRLHKKLHKICSDIKYTSRNCLNLSLEHLCFITCQFFKQFF